VQAVNGRSNSTNDSVLAGQPGLDDNIHIAPGDYIPQMPRNIFKLYGQYRLSSKFAAEMDVLAVGSSFARGNENNLDQPDGVFYLGSGKSAGYGVTNVGARYQIAPRIQLFVQLNNLLEKHYATGAQLSTTPFDNNDPFCCSSLWDAIRRRRRPNSPPQLYVSGSRNSFQPVRRIEDNAVEKPITPASFEHTDSITHDMRSREHAQTRPSPVPVALLLIDVLTTFQFPDGEEILQGALGMRDALVKLKGRAREFRIPVLYQR
jgi:hypothetical protein